MGQLLEQFRRSENCSPPGVGLSCMHMQPVPFLSFPKELCVSLLAIVFYSVFLAAITLVISTGGRALRPEWRDPCISDPRGATPMGKQP